MLPNMAVISGWRNQISASMSVSVNVARIHADAKRENVTHCDEDAEFVDGSAESFAIIELQQERTVML
jgi:hypothetical protein